MIPTEDTIILVEHELEGVMAWSIRQAVPVLWLHGEEDALMPIEGARASAAKIPGAKFLSIPKGGHVSPMENPEAVNAAIQEFLQSL